MFTILSDIKSAAGVFRDIRNSRKAGLSVKAHTTVQIPVMKTKPCLLDTMEGCAMKCGDGKTLLTVQRAYHDLPYEYQRWLLFPPESGEYVERAYAWKELLRSVLEPKQCQRAMMDILHWYQHVKKRKASGAVR